jgi:hypothetical protein
MARTVQSATRLLDAVALFRSDPRIQALFCVDESSVFSRGVSELLARTGGVVVSPGQLDAVDLVVSASENVGLTPRSPLIVVPHGVGFHKYVPGANGNGFRVSGLVSERVLSERRVVMAVSHEDQVAQLAALSPATVGRTAVVGDLTLDQLMVSQALRSRYRRALGLDAGQRLVVITSTWGGQSQFGKALGLAEWLLAELPADEYRVAQILHPNVWAAHGALQIRSWLADALDAGLLLIPAEQGWQATMCCADVVICDHGSLSLYAAALGTPLLTAAFGTEIVPGTPLAALGRSATRLAVGQPLVDQFASASVPDQVARLAAIADSAFARRGDASTALRNVMYALMNLDPPTSRARVRAAPAPLPYTRPVFSFVTHSVLRTVAGVPQVTLRRFPAALEDAGHAEPPGSTRHVVADVDEPDRWLVTNASLVTCGQVMRDAEGFAWAVRTLETLPAGQIAVAAASDGCVALIRGGPRVRVRRDPVAASTSGGERPGPAHVAPAIDALRRECGLRDGPFQLEVGPRVWRLTVEVLG